MSRQQNLANLLARGTANAAQAGPMVTTDTEPATKPTQTTPRKAPKKAAPKPDKTSPKTSADDVADGPMVRAASLIPADLHKEISERADGTFGQLITWSCIDFPDQIVEDVLTSLGAGAQVSRAPRINRGAAPKSNTRQIAPTFLPNENAIVLDLLEQIKQSAADAGVDPGTAKRITRTVLHAAALRRWATEHPQTTTD